MANRSRNFSEKSNGTQLVSGVADMEYFWGIELNSSKKNVTWVIKSQEQDDDDEDYIEHTLVLKLVVLGADAVKGEQNVVVLESTGADGETQKGVIANLTQGENNTMSTELSIPGKVGATFTLTAGSGPVFISGNHVLEYPKEEDYLDQSQEEESEASEEEMAEEEEVEVKKTTKRKAAVKNSKSKQKPKVDADEDDEQEEEDEEEPEEDEDDEDDEDYEDTKAKKGKKGKETKKPEKKQEKSVKEAAKKPVAAKKPKK